MSSASTRTRPRSTSTTHPAALRLISNDPHHPKITNPITQLHRMREGRMAKEKPKTNPSRYWWYVTWVNEKITPEVGYHKAHVGQVYGTNVNKQVFLRGTDKDFHREEDYFHRELIPNCKIGEPWEETLKKIRSFIE